MKYTIEDLKNGKCAAINDGTKEELEKVLKLAFPNDNKVVIGIYTYYFKSNIYLYKWDFDNSTSLQTQSVKDFLKQDMELKTTKERILEAASKCSNAKEVLKTLFPEAFDDIDKIKPFKVDLDSDIIFIAKGFAPKEFQNKCFGLSREYEWSLTENCGYQILIPKKK